MFDLTTYFSSIIGDSNYQLAWAEPEHWVRSELFQRLMLDEARSGLEVVPMEIPYYTKVRSSGTEINAGLSYGKWIDSLIHDGDLGRWQWLELKVIHTTNHRRLADAMMPFVADTTSLLGFSLESTISGWKVPASGMALKKVEPFLRIAIHDLQDASHSFVSAMVILHAEEELGWDFSKSNFIRNIRKRNHLRGQTVNESPPESFEVHVEPIGRNGSGLYATLPSSNWDLV